MARESQRCDWLIVVMVCGGHCIQTVLIYSSVLYIILIVIASVVQV